MGDTLPLSDMSDDQLLEEIADTLKAVRAAMTGPSTPEEREAAQQRKTEVLAEIQRRELDR